MRTDKVRVQSGISVAATGCCDSAILGQSHSSFGYPILLNDVVAGGQFDATIDLNRVHQAGLAAGAGAPGGLNRGSDTVNVVPCCSRLSKVTRPPCN